MRLVRQTEHRRGIAVVEAAVLLLPLFIFTLFGIWEISRIIQIQQIVANAAREGARQASTGQRTSSAVHPELPFNGDYEVQIAVRNYLSNAGLPLTDPGGSTIYTVQVQNVSNGQTSDYPSGATPTSDPASNSVQDINNNRDRLRVTVTYPYLRIKWSPGNFFIPDSRMIVVSSEWYSLKDIPITVDTNIPGRPL